MSIHFHILLSFLAIFGLSLSSIAEAQTDDRCTAFAQTVETLLSPGLGTYTVWDIVYGTPDAEESFEAVLPLSPKEVILGGLQQGSDYARPLLMKMDRRGRVLWRWSEMEKNENIRPIHIKHLAPAENGFIAAGSLKQADEPEAVWLGLFRDDGSLIRENIFAKSDVHYRFGDIIEKTGKEGWLLTMQAQGRATKEYVPPGFSLFFFLDTDLNKLGEKAFIPGPDNRIRDLSVLRDSTDQSFYMAVGEIKPGDGPSAGLILRMNGDGAIDWQRQYPRGKGARFIRGIASSEGVFYALGEAEPSLDSLQRSAWLIQATPGNGREVWERFYTHPDIRYHGADLWSLEDGRLAILLAGISNMDSKNINHTRLITLDPRGSIIHDTTYTSGKGAQPSRMLTGPQELLFIAGFSQVEDADPQAPESKTVITDKGWMVVGEPFPPYKDPCVKEERGF